MVETWGRVMFRPGRRSSSSMVNSFFSFFFFFCWFDFFSVWECSRNTCGGIWIIVSRVRLRNVGASLGTGPILRSHYDSLTKFKQVQPRNRNDIMRRWRKEELKKRDNWGIKKKKKKEIWILILKLMLTRHENRLPIIIQIQIQIQFQFMYVVITYALFTSNAFLQYPDSRTRITYYHIIIIICLVLIWSYYEYSIKYSNTTNTTSWNYILPTIQILGRQLDSIIVVQ